MDEKGYDDLKSDAKNSRYISNENDSNAENGNNGNNSNNISSNDNNNDTRNKRKSSNDSKNSESSHINNSNNKRNNDSNKKNDNSNKNSGNNNNDNNNTTDKKNNTANSESTSNIQAFSSNVQNQQLLHAPVLQSYLNKLSLQQLVKKQDGGRRSQKIPKTSSTESFDSDELFALDPQQMPRNDRKSSRWKNAYEKIKKREDFGEYVKTKGDSKEKWWESNYIINRKICFFNHVF